MKVCCVLHRAEVKCAICGIVILPTDDIEYDHIWPLCHGGPHTYDNIRPLHATCHAQKTLADVKSYAKVRRLRGETKQAPKKPIRSAGFQKGHRPIQSRQRNT